MKHVVYYEPDYDTSAANLWQLRGQYKYPSILGNLKNRARVTIAMHRIPPTTDAHRLRLEREFGVTFAKLKEPRSTRAIEVEYLIESLMTSLAKLKPDVISNLNGRTISYCFASSRVADALGARYVMRVGGDDLGTKAQVLEESPGGFAGTESYYQLMLQERLAAERSDSIIVMSHREKARLAKITRNVDKISVCYRGVDQAHFNYESTRTGPARKFLFVGRNSREKGIDILEEAASRTWRRRDDISFTFAGKFDKVDRQNLRYPGFIAFKDLPRLYRECDCVVVCSRSEGFPQVIMEAMSMGVPCILSKHLFSADFRDQETALFCSCDAADVEAKIEQIANDDTLYSYVSQKAAEYAKANFSDHFMNTYYQDLLLGGE